MANENAAIYARTSGAESASISDQVSIAKRRCKERGWPVRYILKDEGKSGGDPTRPGYQALWDHIDAGAVQVVVCWRIDRIARSLAEMSALEEEFRHLCVALHSCTEPIDTTTPQGRFSFGIMAVAGQLEREMGSQRVRSIMKERAGKGKWMSPVAPFGYCLGKARSLRIHPAEGPVVPQVFAAHIARGSYPEAASQLNRDGLRRRGRRWAASTVRAVVENAIYKGNYHHWHNDLKNDRLRLVPASVWQASERVRAERPNSGKGASEDLRAQSIDNVFSQYIEGLAFLDGGEPATSTPPSRVTGVGRSVRAPGRSVA